LRPADSLRRQLLRWLLPPLLGLLLVNAWFSSRVAVATANQAFDRLLLASADAIADDIELRDGNIVVDLPYAALQLLESNIQERVFYRVVAPDGKTATGYDDLPLPAQVRGRSEESLVYAAQYRGEAIHLVALNKQLYGSPFAAPVVIIVAETGEARDALSRQILTEGLVRQSLLIVAAVLLVGLGLLRGLLPLKHLTASLVARPPSDLSPIDTTLVQAEVRPLIAALNQHTGRIERLLTSRQRLITDASHQMKTPLAEMRTQIEYSLRQDRPELLRQSLQDVHADVDRLARLIEQMLLQANSEPDVLLDQRIADVDLCELARATTVDFVKAARAKGLDLSLEVPADPVVVRGNPLLLRELIANLIDNAIVYSPERGAVTVRVTGGKSASLDVEDHGPGIAVAERERVFERFYRAPGAAQGGSGLGLSIVRNIALAHHAHTVLSTSRGGTGLCIQVRFKPARPDTEPPPSAT
jgi:two-component system sensor histidine kinase TctE